MEDKKSTFLFNIIAPVYSLFYKYQKNNFNRIIKEIKSNIDISEYKTIIDVGCGTGALCSVLNSYGLEVTGIDKAKIMIKLAMKKKENKKIKFFESDIINNRIIEDKSFDIAIASYVAHGLKQEQRRKLYIEMSRIAKAYVIIHDYNNKKNIFTSIIEFIEGGDYFGFIKTSKIEMEECINENKKCFSEIKSIEVGKNANCYICKPFKKNINQ